MLNLAYVLYHNLRHQIGMSNISTSSYYDDTPVKLSVHFPVNHKNIIKNTNVNNIVQRSCR